MLYKLFISFLFFVINLAVVQVLPCRADDISPRSVPVSDQHRLVPDHEIQYEESSPPDWKTNWDLARSLNRDKKYPEALVQYEMLLTQKENLDEARWEYASILMYLKRWDNAKTELEKLLAAEPDSARFSLAMARVSLETGNIDNAVSLYNQQMALAGSDAERISALEGLIRAHEASGQNEKALFFLGQLAALNPQDTSLLLKQASLELQLNNVDRAKELCDRYDQVGPQVIDALVLHAHIEERLNNAENAAASWQKIIAIDPENKEAHQHLYTYYLKNSDWAKSFSHLEPLLKATPNDVVLLEMAADLNLRMGRVDRALEYYEYALAVDPLNRDIAEAKIRAQKVLAQDMLALVENDGGKKLWEDLVNVVPDCAGVYREMASLLREQGKIDRLLEVLILLNRQVPDDKQIYDELVSLLEQQGREEELTTLKASRPDKNTPETH